MDNGIRYLKLTDFGNRGKIVKQEGRKFFMLIQNEWVRVGMFPYFYPDAPEYECYEEVTEAEVNNLIAVI